MKNNKVLEVFKEFNYNTEDSKDGKNYRYYHPLRVFRTAKKIVESEKLAEQVNEDCLHILAIFHDIGRNKKLVEKYGLNPERHNENNIVIFEKDICDLLEDDSDKKKLMEMVVDFSEKKFNLLESQIARDADNLDEIGILNFWRMAVYAGKHSQDVKEIVDFYYNFDRNDKHQKMNKELFLKSSKLIAAEKLNEMDDLMGIFKRDALAEI